MSATRGDVQVLLLVELSDQGNRAACVCVCVRVASWSSLHVCLFVSSSVKGSPSLLFCSEKHGHTAAQFVTKVMDDVC